MKACPNCNAINQDDAAFCGSCGADLAGVPATAETMRPQRAPGEWESSGLGGQVISLPKRLIILGVAGFLATICLLVMIVVGMVSEESSDTAQVIISIANSLVGLYAFLLAMLGAYALAAYADLSRLFSPVKGWMRFLVFGVATGLLYVPLSFVFERAFTFVSRGHHIAYSLERMAEAGFVVVLLAGAFWLLSRRQ